MTSRTIGTGKISESKTLVGIEMRRSSNLDDHVEIWVWFHNYKIRPAVKDKRGIIVPEVAIPKIPYVKGMEKWKLEKLEEYVKYFHD